MAELNKQFPSVTYVVCLPHGLMAPHVRGAADVVVDTAAI